MDIRALLHLLRSHTTGGSGAVVDYAVEAGNPITSNVVSTELGVAAVGAKVMTRSVSSFAIFVCLLCTEIQISTYE